MFTFPKITTRKKIINSLNHYLVNFSIKRIVQGSIKIMFLFLLVSLTFLFYWYSTIHINPGDFPNYPGQLPLIGHLHRMPRNTVDLWTLYKEIVDTGAKIGNVFVIRFGFRPIYVLTDPDDCYKVASASLHKPGLLKKYARKLIGNGLLAAPVSVWKSHRKLLNPSFNQQVLDGFMNDFNEQSRILVKDLEDAVGHTPKDHRLSFNRNALRTICGKPYYFFNWIYRRSKLKRDLDVSIKNIHDFSERMLQIKRDEIANASQEEIKYAGC
ncbi:unnamed protein product [Leptidea sinapis]|uniref:Cytochrome P450 n=1 Tax=Leptidea sinapis TaxID=189913 RepID=A0A5E4QL15_9NEOP|nr:unnamed protein product [Leptidea sinapis]